MSTNQSHSNVSAYGTVRKIAPVGAMGGWHPSDFTPPNHQELVDRSFDFYTMQMRVSLSTGPDEVKLMCSLIDEFMNGLFEDDGPFKPAWEIVTCCYVTTQGKAKKGQEIHIFKAVASSFRSAFAFKKAVQYALANVHSNRLLAKAEDLSDRVIMPHRKYEKFVFDIAEDAGLCDELPW